MENCLIIAFNYIQEIIKDGKENNNNKHSYYYPHFLKKHILYEASISVVNMANGYRYIDKSAFHIPLNNIYQCLNLNNNNINDINGKNIEELVSIDDVNKRLTILISQYNIKYVWVYGINQILFQLSALQNVIVFNIRNATIHKFGDEIKLNDSYCIPQTLNNSSHQQSRQFPPVLQSITNICQMLAKNLIRGYQESTKTMNFYTTNISNPDSKDLQCRLHLQKDAYNSINSTCACLLNEINRLTLMFISASQDLYVTEYKDYINTHNCNERVCQFMTEREVEYKLQALLLSMIWPEKIYWNCSRNDDDDEVHVEVQIINDQHNPLTNGYKWVQWEISNFSKNILKQTRVNHQTSFLIPNIMIFLGYDKIYNVHTLP